MSFDPIDQLPWYVAGLLALVAAMLIFQGLRRRTRRSNASTAHLFCARCEYSLEGLPIGTERRCPECGHSTEKATRGLLRRRPLHIGLGVVLLAASAGLTLPQARHWWEQQQVMHHFPTFLLVWIFQTDLASHRPHAIAYLSTRYDSGVLSSSQVDTLARSTLRLSLGQPARQSVLLEYPNEVYRWVEDASRRGVVSPDDMESAWRSLVNPSLKMRGRLGSDQALAFRLGIHNEMGGRGYCGEYRLVRLSLNGQTLPITADVQPEEEINGCFGPRGSFASLETQVAAAELGLLLESNQLSVDVEVTVRKEQAGQGPIVYPVQPLIVFQIRATSAFERLAPGQRPVRLVVDADDTETFRKYLTAKNVGPATGEAIRLEASSVASSSPAGFRAFLDFDGREFPLSSVEGDAERREGSYAETLAYRGALPLRFELAKAKLVLKPAPELIELSPLALHDIMTIDRSEAAISLP